MKKTKSRVDKKAEELVESNLNKKVKEDKYEENACDFKNESACEEELEDDGLELEDVEKEHFDEEDEAYE